MTNYPVKWNIAIGEVESNPVAEVWTMVAKELDARVVRFGGRTEVIGVGLRICRSSWA